MSVLLLLLALAVVGVAGAVAAGAVTGGLAPPSHSRAAAQLPPGPVRAADVDALRLSTGLRGYRMSEVDAVLARLREELAARDAELEARDAALAHRAQPARHAPQED